jgi:protease-4
MTIDTLIDRRLLKRRLNFWRALAVLAVVVALVMAARPMGGGRVVGDHVERYRITGLINDGHEQIADLARMQADSSVVGVILHLDTPGGEVSGGEGIHDAVAQLAAKKPVVAVMDGTAASAGYMIAVAAPHIVARESTLTGSIGVLLETPNFGGLLEKLGITNEPLVSGPLKNQPSLDKPLSPEGRAVMQGIVDDLYGQFVDLVAAGRHMDAARVRELADGRAYTGRQALKLGLVDQIGGENEAQRWMETSKGLARGLPVAETDKRDLWLRITNRPAGMLVTWLFNALRVDGAWSLWQPLSQRD